MNNIYDGVEHLMGGKQMILQKRCKIFIGESTDRGLRVLYDPYYGKWEHKKNTVVIDDRGIMCVCARTEMKAKLLFKAYIRGQLANHDNGLE